MTIAESLLRGINSVRGARGLWPFTLNASLNAGASRKAEALAIAGVLAHDSVEATITRLRDSGYGGQYGGEVLAEGGQDASTVVDLWVNDPPHYAILMGDHTEMGAAMSLRGGINWWCCDFGKSVV